MHPKCLSKVDLGLLRSSHASRVLLQRISCTVLVIDVEKQTAVEQTNISFSSQQIRFFDSRSLDPVATHSITPHRPEVLGFVAPSTLIYTDSAKFPHHFDTVRALDCSSKTPRPLKKSTFEPGFFVEGLWCVQNPTDGSWLVLLTDADRIYALNLITGQQLWKTERQPDGMKREMVPTCMTADRRGHLFVFDWSNPYVQLFSTRDGEHLGCVLAPPQPNAEVERGECVVWSEALQSLIYSHKVSDNNTDVVVLRSFV